MENLKVGGVLAEIERCDLAWEEGQSRYLTGVTMQEAMAGVAKRRCPVFGQEVSIKIGKINDNGYTTAECQGVGCEHLF